MTRLVDDAGYKIHELSEIAPIKDELINLLAGDRAAQLRRLRLDLNDALTGHLDYFIDLAHGQLHVDADLLSHVQHDFRCREFLESFCCDSQVIGATRQSSHDIGAVCIRCR